MNIGFCDRIEFCGDSYWTSCANWSEMTVSMLSSGKTWNHSEGGVIEMTSDQANRRFSEGGWIATMGKCLAFAILFFPALIVRTINRCMYTFTQGGPSANPSTTAGGVTSSKSKSGNAERNNYTFILNGNSNLRVNVELPGGFTLKQFFYSVLHQCSLHGADDENFSIQGRNNSRAPFKLTKNTLETFDGSTFSQSIGTGRSMYVSFSPQVKTKQREGDNAIYVRGLRGQNIKVGLREGDTHRTFFNRVAAVCYPDEQLDNIIVLIDGMSLTNDRVDGMHLDEGDTFSKYVNSSSGVHCVLRRK